MWVESGHFSPYLFVMAHDRSHLWRELCRTLIQAKRADTIEARDALLEQVGEWSERLAETEDLNDQGRRRSSEFIEAAMQEVGDDGWVMSLDKAATSDQPANDR